MPRTTPERAQTDASLDRERRKTDDALIKRSAADEATADAVLETARQRADAVLDRARETADDRLRQSGTTAEARSIVARERHEEDEALRRERASAAETLAHEREARRRALLALLAIERQHTDDHLANERARSDAAVRSRDDFLAMASHDLRNILGGIAMSTDALLVVRGEDEMQTAVAREAGRIRRYTGRMGRLVGDLLDVVSLEAGRLAVFPALHDATELVRETVHVFAPLAAASGVALEAKVRAGPLFARFDEERVLQVLTNLVGNALKFTGDGGRIEIVVEPAGDDLRFAVTDTGTGIDAEELGRIFDRDWRHLDKRTRSGLGLGLTISRAIVEAHRGTIWAKSRTGEGSTFAFTLPASPGP